MSAIRDRGMELRPFPAMVALVRDSTTAPPKGPKGVGTREPTPLVFLVVGTLYELWNEILEISACDSKNFNAPINHGLRVVCLGE